MRFTHSISLTRYDKFSPASADKSARMFSLYTRIPCTDFGHRIK